MPSAFASSLTDLFMRFKFSSKDKADLEPVRPTPPAHNVPHFMQQTSKFYKKHKGEPQPPIRADADMYTRQAACLLFSELPVELREMMWEYVVGGETIHMYWQCRETLLGYICAKQDPCTSISHEPTRKAKWDVAAIVDETTINQKKGFMPLLLTCRATYFEASKIMYTTNTFDFTDHWSNLKYLQWSLPLFTMCTIARIHMTCYGMPLPSTSTNVADFRAWIGMWDALALCKGLRYLHVELMLAKADEVTVAELQDAEREFLEPIGKIEEPLPVVFEVLLPWPKETFAGASKNEAPREGCMILRRDNAGL